MTTSPAWLEESPLTTRFMAKVGPGSDDHPECWEWTGARSGTGYPYLKYRGRSVPVIRFLIAIFSGQWPDAETVIRHSCDNPRCVRPLHLSPGTFSENLQEAYDRGRR